MLSISNNFCNKAIFKKTNKVLFKLNEMQGLDWNDKNKN
jgi:hypothetical protein